MKFLFVLAQLKAIVVRKGATREEAMGAEAPPLAKSKLKKRKNWDSIDIFLFQWSEVAWFSQFLIFKIDFDTIKLQKVLNNIILMTL